MLLCTKDEEGMTPNAKSPAANALAEHILNLGSGDASSSDAGSSDVCLERCPAEILLDQMMQGGSVLTMGAKCYPGP